MNWLDAHLETQEEDVVGDSIIIIVTNTVMMHSQGREVVEKAGEREEVLGIGLVMLRER